MAKTIDRPQFARGSMARSAENDGTIGLHHGEHLFICLDRISEAWFEGRGPKKAEASTETTSGERIQKTDEKSPSFESLSLAAEARGVALSYQEKPLRALNGIQMPVVIILKNGLGVIVCKREKVGLRGAQLSILTQGRMIEASQEELNAVYGGVFITPTPRDEQQSDEASSSNATTNQASISLGRIGDGVSAANNAAPAQKQSLIRVLLAAMRQNHKGLLIQLLVASGLSNLLMITLPLFIMTVYDRVIPHRALETLWALSLGVLIALGLDLVLRRVKLTLIDAIGLSISTRMQARLFRRLVHVKTSHAPKTAGGLTSAMKDVESVSALLPNLISAVLVDLPFIILVLLLIASIAGSVVVAPIVGIAIIALSTWIGHRRVAQSSAVEMQFIHKRINSLVETVSSLVSVKATGAQKQLLNGWERSLDASAVPSHQTRMNAGFSTQITMIVVQMAIVGSVIIGVYHIGSGAMSVGALAATTLLVGRVLSPVGQLMTLSVRTAQLANSVGSASLLLDAPEEEGGDRADVNKINDAKIVCHGIGLTYDGATQAVLQDINLTIQPGEKIGIVGRNGSGKSSLLHVLTRFYDPTMGTMTIDDTHSAQISPQDVRDAIALMPQETSLFDGTLYDNLTFGLDAFDKARFAAAMNVSGVSDFVRSHPEGFSMKVGPRGERLSGGERQCVVLARTLLRPAKMFILDEPTSALDNSAEARIVAALREHIGASTLIVSTHRANILAIVDRIIWMDKGKIIADGPRAEVLSRLHRAA